MADKSIFQSVLWHRTSYHGDNNLNYLNKKETIAAERGLVLWCQQAWLFNKQLEKTEISIGAVSEQMRYIKGDKRTTPATALIGLPQSRPQICVVKEQNINTHPAIFAEHNKQVLGQGASVFRFSPEHLWPFCDHGCVVLTGNRDSRSSYVSQVMQRTTAIDFMRVII